MSIASGGNSSERRNSRQVEGVSCGAKQQSFECSSALSHFEETVIFKPQQHRTLHTNSMDLKALKSLWMSLQELRAAYSNLYFNLCFHVSSYMMMKSFPDFSVLLCSHLPFLYNATYSSFPSPFR